MLKRFAAGLTALSMTFLSLPMGEVVPNIMEYVSLTALAAESETDAFLESKTDSKYVTICKESENTSCLIMNIDN